MSSSSVSESTGSISSESETDVALLSQVDFMAVASYRYLQRFSLLEIAKAIHYDNKDIFTNISRNDDLSNQDKIIHLLMSWKEQNRSICTWNKLKECLATLDNNELNNYLERIHPSEENLREPLEINIIDRESDTLLLESRDPESLFPEPIIATSRASGSKCMVTGFEAVKARSTLSAQELQVLKNKISSVQRHFSCLQTVVFSNLNRKEDIDVIKVYISSRMQEPIGNVKILDPKSNEIIMNGTLAQVFQFLNIHGFWNFLNYYLLEEIITEFDKNMLLKLTEYEEAVSTFRKETKLCDFLEVWPKILDGSTYPDAGVVISKLRRDWSECTLQVVVETQLLLAGMFRLNRFMLNFCEANQGCVELRWLVPLPVFRHMKLNIGNINLKGVRIINTLDGNKNKFCVVVSEGIKTNCEEDGAHTDVLQSSPGQQNRCKREEKLSIKAVPILLRTMSLMSSTDSNSSQEERIGVTSPKDYEYKQEIESILRETKAAEKP